MYVSLAVEDCELGLKSELIIWFSALIFATEPRAGRDENAQFHSFRPSSSVSR